MGIDSDHSLLCRAHIPEPSSLVFRQQPLSKADWKKVVAWAWSMQSLLNKQVIFILILNFAPWHMYQSYRDCTVLISPCTPTNLHFCAVSCGSPSIARAAGVIRAVAGGTQSIASEAGDCRAIANCFAASFRISASESYQVLPTTIRLSSHILPGKLLPVQFTEVAQLFRDILRFHALCISGGPGVQHPARAFQFCPVKP